MLSKVFNIELTLKQNKQKYKFAVLYDAGIMAGLSRLREVAALFNPPHG